MSENQQEREENMENSNIKLTKEEIITLTIYLQMTTKYRKEEQIAYEELGSELDEDGNLEFPNIASNAKWWMQTELIIQSILNKLNSAINDGY